VGTFELAEKQEKQCSTVLQSQIDTSKCINVLASFKDDC